MKNARGTGNTIATLAPEGGVESGKLTRINGTVLVPTQTTSAGEAFVGYVRGSFEFDKYVEEGGFTATAGDLAYWDEAMGLLVPADDADAIVVGFYTEDSAADDDKAVVSLSGNQVGELNNAVYACLWTGDDATGDTVNLQLLPLGAVEPAVGDNVFLVMSYDPYGYVIGTDFGRELVNDYGAKLAQLQLDLSEKSGIALIVKG